MVTENRYPDDALEGNDAQPPKVLLLYAHPESMTRSRIGFCFDRRSSWNMSPCTIYTRTILTFLLIFTTNNNCCVNIRSLFFNIHSIPTVALHC